MTMDLLSPEERAELMTRPRAAERRASLPIVGSRPALLPARAEDQAVRPLIAVWEITLRCDLGCRHCGSRAGLARKAELDTAEALDLVRQLSELGVREVTLIGGEVYLREDWLGLLRAVRDRGMLPTVVTGGRGMSLTRARAAKEAGIHSVSVSIDGAQSTHDRLRGLAGSHEAAVEALHNLSRAEVPIAVNTQVNRLTMRDLPAVLDTISAAGALSWQVLLTVPMGRAADEPDVLLQPYDLLTVFPMLETLAIEARARGIDFVAGNNVGYFGPHERTLRRGLAYQHSGSCGAGITTLGIEADGTIKGCPSLSTESWAGGNIRDRPLLELWERAPALRTNRDPPELWGYCASCYYAAECRGGCTWMADSLFGRGGNNPYCHHRAEQLSAAGVRERVVLVERAPGGSFDRGRFEIVQERFPGG